MLSCVVFCYTYLYFKELYMKYSFIGILVLGFRIHTVYLGD